MYKILNIFIFLIVIFFIFSVYKYYSSNKNIKNTVFNRSNIDKILNEKVSTLPILKDNTGNVIIFNDSFNKEIQNDKKRSFWDLLRNKWKKKLLSQV